MKKNIPIYLLLISICLTGIGTVFKLMDQRTVSEIFLWIGMIAFFISLAGLIAKLFTKKEPQ